MTIFGIGAVFQCGICKDWYTHGMTSCLAQHAPGTCCHIYDKPAADPRTD